MKGQGRVMATVWIIMGLIIVIWSSTFPFGSTGSPGPAYLPLGCGLVLVGVSSIMLIKTMTITSQKQHSSNVRTPFFVSHRGTLNVVLTLIAILLSAGLMQVLGFILSLFLLMLFLMKFISRKGRWRTALFYSLVYTVGIYLCFVVLLKVTLPRGFLGL